jgi:hypothetical protein
MKLSPASVGDTRLPEPDTVASTVPFATVAVVLVLLLALLLEEEVPTAA